MRAPEVFLADEDRILRCPGAIDDNDDNPDAVASAYLREAIEATLAEDRPDIETTSPVGRTIKWK